MKTSLLMVCLVLSGCASTRPKEQLSIPAANPACFFVCNVNVTVEDNDSPEEKEDAP